MINKKKHKQNNSLITTSIIIGVSLIVVLSVLIATSIISINNAYFARIRVAIKKKVQIVYNYNLFDANNDSLKEYNKDTKTLVIDGNLNSNNIVLGSLDNMSFKKGDKYRITINYISGSYTNNPQFVFELQKDNEYYTDRKNGTHYIAGTLPTKGITYDRVITIKEDTKDANGFNYRIYEDNEVTFNNYKIQILITKLESKIGVAGEKYGKLPTPEKDGYEFLGWYDSISGGKKITETNTILKKYNHPLYAHWEKKKNDYTKVNYANFKWHPFKEEAGPVSEIYSSVTPYAIWAPDDIKDLNDVSLPLIVWLNGSGELEFYMDIYKFVRTAFPEVISEWSKSKLQPIPAIIVAPQGLAEWNNSKVEERHMESIKALIEYTSKTYNIDMDKITLMGHSIGGNGVVYLSYDMQKKYNHDYFSKLIITSGTTDLKYPAKDLDSGYAYFSKKDVKAYNEDNRCIKFFEWTNKLEHFKLLKYTSHGEAPRVAMYLDENNNGISDIVEWIAYDIDVANNK